MVVEFLHGRVCEHSLSGWIFVLVEDPEISYKSLEWTTTQRENVFVVGRYFFVDRIDCFVRVSVVAKFDQSPVA